MHYERKVMSDQFVITLPVEWRQKHKISKGDVVELDFNPEGVIIVAAKDQNIHPLEARLIRLLVNMRFDLRNKEVIEDLLEFVDRYKAEAQVG